MTGKHVGLSKKRGYSGVYVSSVSLTVSDAFRSLTPDLPRDRRNPVGSIAVISHTNRPSSPHSPAEYLPGGLASVMMPVPWVTTVTRIHNEGDVVLDLFQEPG